MLEQERAQEVIPNLEKERRYLDCPAIVLVTDFGDDLASAECRLSALTVFKEHQVAPYEFVYVNDIAPFNQVHAAFTLYRLAAIAPEGTIFIGVIDPGVGTGRKGIIIQTEKNHVYIGPDNGIFYPIVSHEGIKQIIEIDNSQFPSSSTTFHGRDIFSKAAARIACGFDPRTLGRKINELEELKFRAGQIVHIDFFGNLKVFGDIPLNATHCFLNGHQIPIVNTFEDVEIGQPLAYSGSSGLLEIAIREGNAKMALGCKIGDLVDLKFT